MADTFKALMMRETDDGVAAAIEDVAVADLAGRDAAVGRRPHHDLGAGLLAEQRGAGEVVAVQVRVDDEPQRGAAGA